MAARSLSAQFLTVFQRSTFCSTIQPFAASRQAAAIATERSICGGSFISNRGLHSETQAREDNRETHEYENEKMTAEGGGSVEHTFHEKSQEVKQQAGQKVENIAEEVEDKAGEAADQAKGQVSKNIDTTKDMFKDFPQKMSDTATGLKEVGVEAGKAVKRDAEKLAQSVGLKSD